jgi:hypothetical protein
MRGLLTWLWGIVVVAGCLYLWSRHQTKQDDLDVATAVADAFLGAALEGDSNSLFALASKNYQERIPKAPAETRLDLLPSNVKNWRFVEKEISANKSQVALVGSFSRPKSERGGISGITLSDLGGEGARANEPRRMEELEELAFRVLLIKELYAWRLDVFTCEKNPRSR